MMRTKTEAKVAKKTTNKKPKGDYEWNGETTPDARRNVVLNETLIAEELKKHGLPEEGTIVERARRLESVYLDGNIQDLMRCEPPDGTTSEDTTALGCLYSSPDDLPACPFCGMTGVEGNAAPTTTNKPEAKPAEEKPAEVKVTAAEVKAKKDKRKKEKAVETPAESTPAEPPANDVTSMKRDVGLPVEKKAAIMSPDDIADQEALDGAAGGTLADLDALIKAAKDAKDLRERIDAETFWDEGFALQKIHDLKLWTLVVREEDGKRAYPTFEHFVGEVFDYARGHAWFLIKISRSLTRSQATSIGVGASRSVAVAYSRFFELFGEDVANAQRARLLAEAPKKTTRELEQEVSRLNNAAVIVANEYLKTPEKDRPAILAEIGRADADRMEADAKRITAPKLPEREPVVHVDHNDDGVVIEDNEDEDHGAPNSRRIPEPKTVSVSLGETSFEVPLYVNGSSTKAAKKVEDGAHGSLSTLTGHSIKFELRIGDGGQLHVDVKITRPR